MATLYETIHQLSFYLRPCYPYGARTLTFELRSTNHSDVAIHPTCSQPSWSGSVPRLVSSALPYHRTLASISDRIPKSPSPRCETPCTEKTSPFLMYPSCPVMTQQAVTTHPPPPNFGRGRQCTPRSCVALHFVRPFAIVCCATT